MLCKIADLIVDLPEAGGLASRCKEYLCSDVGKPDIVIDTDQFRTNAWKSLSEDGYIYMETGELFYVNLLKYNGMMLHASAIYYDGKAYLFSAPSGTGKSTHARLWQSVLGESAIIFNDDKPALRYINGVWYAYGTPWCGKDGINVNIRVPLAGICFLKQSSCNRIVRLSSQEAAEKIIWQTLHRFKNVDNLDRMIDNVNRLIEMVPVFELENRPEPEAAMLSFCSMRQTEEEMRHDDK